MAACYKCGKEITSDEIGLNKKIVNRGVEKYLCIECLAEYFVTTVEALRENIERFRRAGCHFFAQKADSASEE